LIEGLNTVQGGADWVAIRSWPLYELWRYGANSNLARAVRKGMQLAKSLDDEELYYRFDLIDDELQLATRGMYGTAAERRSDFEAILKEGMSQVPHDVMVP